MHKNPFKTVGEVLNTDKNFKIFNLKVKEQEVLEKFPELFPKLKNLVKPKRIVNSILFLSVENSVLRSELNINKKSMLKKINKELDNSIITDIKFGK